MKDTSSKPSQPRANGLYAEIKRLILSGELKPGERLVERQLAKRFGVSRIPLRESLIRLEGEGLVRSVDNTATYVEDVSPQDMFEILVLRAALEPLGNRLAALHATAQLMGSLRQLCERMTRMSRRGDWAEVDKADFEFHRTLIVASGNRRLIRCYNLCQVQQILGGAGPKGILRSQPAETTAKVHETLLETVGRGDPEAAEREARAHVDGSIQTFLRYYGFVVQNGGAPGRKG